MSGIIMLGTTCISGKSWVDMKNMSILNKCYPHISVILSSIVKIRYANDEIAHFTSNGDRFCMIMIDRTRIMRNLCVMITLSTFEYEVSPTMKLSSPIDSLIEILSKKCH